MSPEVNVVHLTHDEACSALYVAFQNEYEGPVVTREYNDGVIHIDSTPDGRLVGLEILNADAFRLETYKTREALDGK